MPYADGTPTPEEHADTARAQLAFAMSQGTPPEYVAPAAALAGIGHALLAVAGELAAIREQGIYRPGDGT